jgi:hypothetical protein
MLYKARRYLHFDALIALCIIIAANYSVLTLIATRQSFFIHLKTKMMQCFKIVGYHPSCVRACVCACVRACVCVTGYDKLWCHGVNQIKPTTQIGL